MISASHLERIAACPGSEKLPQIERTTPWAARGHAIHAFVQRIQELGLEEALAQAPEEDRDVCESLNPTFFTGLELAAEVAFAYNPFDGTARELGRGLERKYETISGEIPGTADLVGIDVQGDGVLVLDVKTGARMLPRPDQSWQLRFLALAACRAYGKNYARVGYVHVRFTGDSSCHMAELGPADLEAFEEELDGLLLSLAVLDSPQLSEGAHCTYCPAFASCPAKVTLLTALAVNPQTPDELLRPHGGAITAANAAVAWQRVNAILEAADRVKENLKDFARQQPFAVDDTHVVEERGISKESLNPSELREILRAKYGEKVADSAVGLSTSKADLKEALRSVSPRGTLAQNERTVLDKLRKAGGVSTKVEMHVREWSK